MVLTKNPYGKCDNTFTKHFVPFCIVRIIVFFKKTTDFTSLEDPFVCVCGGGYVPLI